MSTFLSLSDDDIELLNRQFGLKLTREEWNRRLTTTPTFASLVRSYFDWHISELAALAAGDDRLPAGINAIDAPFPPTARGASEPDARLRAARFMLETIRPIPEDGEAREKRISFSPSPFIRVRFPTPPSCDASSISPAAGTTAPTKWMPRAP